MRIGDVEICLERSLVRRGHQDVLLRRQTLRVLTYLIEHRHRLVSREELHAAIWEETAVTPDALVQCVVDLRKALGDTTKQPRFIRTVPRMGYQFIAPVDEPGADTVEPDEPRRSRPWAIAAAAALTAAGALGIITLAGVTPTARWSDPPAARPAPAPARTPLLRPSEVMTTSLDAYRDYVLGLQKVSAVEPEAAIALFDSAVRHDPNFAMAHARIGATLAVTLGDADKALPHLARAFQLSDKLREVDRLWILAWHALAKLDYEGAVAPLRTLNAKYPGEIEAYSVLAGILIGRERWAEAAAAIERGLTIDPDATELHNLASRAAAGAGRGDAALDAARRYVALAPGEANAHDTLGLRLQDLGRYDEAIDAFAQARRLNARFDIAMAHMGNVYFAQGRYREAAAAYETFVAARPDQESKARGIGALAWIAFNRGDDTTAWTLARRAAAASPRDPWPALYFAVRRRDAASYRRIKSTSGWEQYSNRGTPWSPILVRYMTALDLRNAGRDDDALAELRQAVAHPPLGWSIDPLEDSLGQAYVDLERWDDARAEFERLAHRRPWVARYHYRLAQLADRRGDAALAIDRYKRFLSLWPKADADLKDVVAARQRIKSGL